MDFAALALLAFLVLLAFFIGERMGSLKAAFRYRLSLPKVRQDAVKKSREVLGGTFSEQLAPYLPNFPYSPTEARFIGKPIDLIIFKGLDSKEPEEIVFLEVKSGKSQLSPVERRLKQVIKEKKVRWEEYRVGLNDR